MHRTLRAFALATTTTLALSATVTGASADVVVDYRMDETSSTPRVMTDSSGNNNGNGYPGTVGEDVRMNQSLADGQRGYYFPGPFSGYDPGRIATVEDEVAGNASALDPGTSTYAVTVRFRTTASRPNIVQKGQNGQNGGFWKLVLKEGWPRCHYEDSTGRIRAIGFVNTSTAYKVNDGDWHTLRCERLSTGVRVTLDYGTPGAVSKFISGTLGTVDNKHPLMVGGKLYCPEGATLPKNGREVNCDYFVGWIDWVMIEKGTLSTTPFPDHLY